MATIESEVPTGDESDSDALVYDGFISYSHAADDLLAPRLQAGLQRFAKPWWKRRALRIFRDESSLSANPHLWSSITEALDSSRWFVLLLSPDAADSPWVNQEIEYWKQHKDPSRILPVLTDGTFEWTEGDVSGSAVPEQLHGSFSEEPRWVDMRFAREEMDLDLKDPRFADAVADIASALRGVPKDELASEEVKQHRRTIRTAWVAGVLVGVLGVAAVVFGIQSADNARVAEANAEAEAAARTEAETQRSLAEENAANAVAQAERADQEAAKAIRASQLARSQELAAASTSVLDTDPELASLLAVLSIQLAPGEVPPESVRALRKADKANLLRERIAMGGEGFGSLTPDEKSIITFTSTADSWHVSSYDLATGAVNWQTSVDEYFDEGLSTALSPDGLLAVTTGRHTETNTGVLLVLSISDGEILESVTEECPSLGWQESGSPFTPDGSLLALSTGTADCEVDPEASWVSFRDATTWQEVDRLEVPSYFEVVQFDESGTRFLLADKGTPAVDRLELRSYPEMELIQAFAGYGGGASTLAPSGDLVAYSAGSGVRIHSAESGEFLGWVEGEGTFLIGAGLVFSQDGSRLLVTTEEGAVVVDSSNGKLITRLASNRGVLDASFARDGASVVTTYVDQIEVWSLAHSSGAVPLLVGSSQAAWVNPNRVFEGPALGILVFAGTFPVDLEWWLVVVNETTGETLAEIPAIAADQLSDGRFVIAERLSGAEEDLMHGGLAIWDPRTGSLDRITECPILASTIEELESMAICPDGEPVFGLSNVGVVASPDGSMIAAISDFRDPCETGTRLVRVWDVASGSEVATVEIDGCDDLRLLGHDWVMTEEGVYDISDESRLSSHDAGSFVYEMTHDGSFVVAVAGGPETTVLVFDTRTWDVIAEWDAHGARVRGVAISPESSLLATTGTDGLIRVWDMGSLLSGGFERTTPRLLDEIPLGIASDAYWISKDSLGLVFRDGTWTTVTLDPLVLANAVLDRLQRSFTSTECENFRINPCPTLEDMQEG